jgi:hypothetical protein
VIHAVRRRFVKNYCSPILLVQDSYFEYMLGLYEPFFGARTKLGPLLDEIRDCGSEDAFLPAGNALGDAVVEAVQNTPPCLFLRKDPVEDYEISAFAPTACTSGQ